MRVKMRRKVTSVSRIPGMSRRGRRRPFEWVSLPAPGAHPGLTLQDLLTKLVSREVPCPEGLAVGKDHLVLQLQPISLWGVGRPKGSSGQVGEGSRKGRGEKPAAGAAPYPTLAECDIPPSFPHRAEAAATGAAEVAGSLLQHHLGRSQKAETRSLGHQALYPST